MKVILYICLVSFTFCMAASALTVSEKTVDHVNKELEWIYHHMGNELPFTIERIEYDESRNRLLCYSDASSPVLTIWREAKRPSNGFTKRITERGTSTYVLNVPMDHLRTKSQNLAHYLFNAAIFLGLFGFYLLFAYNRSYIEYRISSPLHPEDFTRTQGILKRAGVRCRVSTKLCMAAPRGAQISAGKTTILLVHKKDLDKANKALTEN